MRLAPRILREPAISLLAGATSDLFDIGAVDLFYVAVSGGDIEAIFFPPSSNRGVYDGATSEPLTLVDGETLSLDQGEMSSWGGVQLRNTSGVTVTVDLILNCRGRN